MDDSHENETNHANRWPKYFRMLVGASPFVLFISVHIGALVYESKHPNRPSPAKVRNPAESRLNRMDAPKGNPKAVTLKPGPASSELQH